MESEGLRYVAIGMMAFGMMGAALGVGQIFSAAVTGIARNPAAEEKIFKNTIIGAALAEAMGLFALVVGFMLLK